MTVSRVVNGHSKVRQITRDAVNAAIAALGYVPNPAARRLAGATQARIGLLYSNPSASYLSEVLVGSLDQARRSNVQLVLEKCDLGDHEIEVANRLIDGGIDGLILPSPLCDSPKLIRTIAARNIPALLVGSGRPDKIVNSVGIDEYAAACTMTRHIVSLGHHRIGFVIGHPEQTASEERLRGYRDALAKAGIPFDDALIAQGMFTYRSGLDAAEKLLDVDNPPTAIFASNDDMAAACVAVAHRRGLDVPGDLTVCGFDDTTLSTKIWPELTTINQPIADMSRAAVEILASAVRRPREDGQQRHVVLDFTLVRRQSDAAPRRRPPSRSTVPF